MVEHTKTDTSAFVELDRGIIQIGPMIASLNTKSLTTSMRQISAHGNINIQSA